MKTIFWSSIIILFFFQLIFTVNSMSQIRYEELAESVRNVYWFQNRLIYDGTSSNVGWYSVLLIIYNIFGFSLFTAKIFRLFLFLISILCLALLLKKYLGYKNGLLPLYAIGLSPAFLYFNSLQAQYGIELQTIPILLYLILTLDIKRKTASFIKQFLIGLISMLTWTSYPTFIYYLPALAFIYFLTIKKVNNKVIIFKNIFYTLASFLSPLVLFFIYVKNRNILIFDHITQSGIFRGAGKIDLNLNQISQNLSKLFIDLFEKGNSYYFEVASSDFSNFYPAITFLFVLTLSVILIKNKKFRLIILITFSVLFLTLIVSSITSDPSNNPGIRRNTGVIASFYVLFTVCWYYATNNIKYSVWLKTFMVVFLFLPIHHFISFPANLISLNTPSPYQYTMWFGLTKNPDDSLNLIVNENTKKDLPLSCKNKKGEDAFCRYNETFAAVSGYCLWNKLDCKKITGYDNKTKKFIPLSTKLWEEYYWEH